MFRVNRTSTRRVGTVRTLPAIGYGSRSGPGADSRIGGVSKHPRGSLDSCADPQMVLGFEGAIGEFSVSRFLLLDLGLGVKSIQHGLDRFQIRSRGRAGFHTSIGLCHGSLPTSDC